MAFSKYADFDAAVGFSAKAGFSLTDIQVQDVESFLQWQRSLNTYEVGGGKTVVSTVVSLMRGEEIACTVVTVLPILIPGWVKWLRKVSDNVVDYSGPPKHRATLDMSKARWIVLSHALFREDFALIQQTAMARAKEAGGAVELIVDEAHAMKNVKSVLFKRTQLFTAGDRLVQMLTGTPVNKPLDSYSYIKIKSPSLYRTMGHFEAIHVAKRDFWKVPIQFANLELMKENLALQTISRTKEEAHGYNLVPLFPDSEYDLSPEHYKLYVKLVDEQLLTLPDGKVIDATTHQKLRHALQQAVVNFDHFSGVPENRSRSYDMIDLSLEETECATIGKSKLIIWTKYRRTTEAVMAYLAKVGVTAVAAYGGGNSAKAIELFMEAEAARVLVAQYQSASAGLNPQYVCSESLFLEGDTVALYMRQAIGRINRVGQTKVPRCRLAIARGTVQVDLFGALLKNDDYIEQIEPTKKSIRAMLLGE